MSHSGPLFFCMYMYVFMYSVPVWMTIIINVSLLLANDLISIGYVMDALHYQWFPYVCYCAYCMCIQTLSEVFILIHY